MQQNAITNFVSKVQTVLIALIVSLGNFDASMSILCFLTIVILGFSFSVNGGCESSGHHDHWQQLGRTLQRGSGDPEGLS